MCVVAGGAVAGCARAAPAADRDAPSRSRAAQILTPVHCPLDSLPSLHLSKSIT